MPLNKRLENQLKVVRGIAEQMLAVFETPEQWTHQVHDQANHALWFVGHIGTVDDFMLRMAGSEKSSVPDGYREKFALGSQPTANAADYPPVEEVLAYWRRQRETLLATLAELSDDDLAKPAPAGGPGFITDVASIFESAVWHEAMHLGQVTVARRALGHAPLAGGKP